MLLGWCGKMNKDFWHGKSVLITGNTGFKGSWMSQILLSSGADVHGYALENNDNDSIFNAIELDKNMDCNYGDICDEEKLAGLIERIKPEIVFHLAAQPIVRLSYVEPIYTYKTNVIGTAVLLNCLRKCDKLRSVVNITTDKVYENGNNDAFFSEKDKLGGYDPYASSKACSEIVTSSFMRSFFDPQKFGVTHSTAIATARAGNVIGGGDVSPDRIIPDCIRAVKNKSSVTLRNPMSIRPWQNVLEPLSLYITLAEKLYDYGVKYNGAYNVGPSLSDCLTVVEIVKLMKSYIPELEYNVSDNAVKEEPHEDAVLTLNTGKIYQLLDFSNKWDINDAVKNTALWYKAQMNGEDMKDVTEKMIQDYFTKDR